MTIVITNDDGVDAPGLAALVEAAAGLDDIIVVGPMNEWSGCGHKVTTHAPIRVVKLGERRFAIDGTPADCVRVALHELAPDARWVLSGINAGGNLGADIVHSGTVAAAREATLHRRHALAVSHYIRRGVPIDWTQATRFARAVIRELMLEPPPAGWLWNVNLPHLPAQDALPPVIRCDADPSPLPLAFRRDGDALRYSGDYHARVRLPGHDIAACFGGSIAVSSIHVM